MKIVFTCLLLFNLSLCFGQVDDNQFVESTQSFDLNTGESAGVFAAVASANARNSNAPLLVQSLIAAGNPALNLLLNSYNTAITNLNDDYALIVVFRKMNAQGFNDSDATHTVVYHRSNRFGGGAVSKYLLETSHVAILFLDLDDGFFQANAATAEKLSNTKISITYNTSYFRQSAKDLSNVLKTMGAQTDVGGVTRNVKATWTVIAPKRIKAPCAIVLSNKSFDSDIKFEIHERNIASFQVGLVNAEYSVQDFKISGGNLIVSPDTAKQKEWKSNLFAAIEIHLPRDIDNFRPMWKELFYVDPDQRAVGKTRAFTGWLYRNTLNRIGLYGGAKISKDPLSNLFAGFNYAVTKDVYVNFGWAWNNEIEPQITDIGTITSLDEAKSFAKRSYSKPTFSIGLSFAPSGVVKMLGLGNETEKK